MPLWLRITLTLLVVRVGHWSLAVATTIDRTHEKILDLHQRVANWSYALFGIHAFGLLRLFARIGGVATVGIWLKNLFLLSIAEVGILTFVTLAMIGMSYCVSEWLGHVAEREAEDRARRGVRSNPNRYDIVEKGAFILLFGSFASGFLLCASLSIVLPLGFDWGRRFELLCFALVFLPFASVIYLADCELPPPGQSKMERLRIRLRSLFSPQFVTDGG